MNPIDMKPFAYPRSGRLSLATAFLLSGLSLCFGNGIVAAGSEQAVGNPDGCNAASANPVAFDWFEYSGTDPDATGPLKPGTIRNPVFSGFYPDPSIHQVGADYYLINSTFAYFPGLPIFHSRDLVNWRQIGHIIDRPEQLPYDGISVSNGLFAPALTYHDGTYYAVCTMVGGQGNFVVTATDPAGSWSDPVYTPFEGIDPSLFFDDDGRAWMVNNGAPVGDPLYEGHRAIWIQEFDPVAKQMIGPRQVLVNGGVDISTRPIWIEGPHLFKVNGLYYLSCAEGGTGPDHSQVIFRSAEVSGPYLPWRGNPILTQRTLDPHVPGAVTCTGHADYVIGPDGNWWAVFLGVRPYEGDFSPMGRETFMLPMEWTEDGWPMILPSDQRVPLVLDAPAGANFIANPELPMSGSFKWRDDFTTSDLSLLWIMLRAPAQEWWEVDPSEGLLKLVPRQEKLFERNNPSFLGRRIQHPVFEASLAFAPPVEAGVSAGLAVFQNDTHHYYAGVRRQGDGLFLFLERALKDAVDEIASVALPDCDSISLRIISDKASCRFEYSVASGDWVPFATDLDAKMLTTAVAGGFVGATVGPHARMD